ncbi:MAG: aminopeptidase, partial [Planctomycetota bacterium]|nr:aminopeptidase [Planctomycetota bacterium]
MKARVAELVLRKCLGYRPGESVVLVTDTELESVAKSFLSACNEIEIEVTLLQMSPRTAHGDEPTGVIAEAMKSASIVLLLTTKSLSHTQARINASAAGVRIASMPAPDPARIEYLLDIDYGKLSERGEAIASQIRGGRVMRLTSKEGTDLTFEIENQPLHVDGGDLTAPGSFGNLPAGEVYLSPVIETARGVLMVDGSMSQFGEVTTPVRIDFKKGRPIQIGDPTLREWMESHGEDVFHLAEVGMGTNPRAEVIGNIVEDEKAIGT